ncbi:TonB-dependent receptor [Eilatimonas milleporae]|nr:TonB-dependent receptor [Eilatimonas milleporae]
MLGGAASAQNGTDTVAFEDDGPDVEEIVVRGEKFERSLQDTTSSVAVFTNEMIDQQNFIDLYDLFDQTANVSGLFNDQGFTIRGLRNTGAAPGDQTSDVSTIYLDGVFIPSNLFQNGGLNLWDIQSVEIFRGPQSTIQGRNALAGAVVARTIDPDYELSGRAQASYGEFNSIRGSAAVSLPVVEDQIAVRFAGDYTRTDGFNDNPTLGTDDGDRRRSLTLRGKILLEPQAIPDLTVRLNYSYIDSDEGENRIDEDLFPEERITTVNVRGSNAVEANILSAEMEYDINENWGLTSVTAYIDNQLGFLFDGTNDETGPDSPGFTNRDNQIFSQELRVSFSNDSVDTILGGYLFDSSEDFLNGSTNIILSEFAFPDPATLAGILFQTPAPDMTQIATAAALRSDIVATFPSFPVNFDRSSSQDIRNYAVFGEVSYHVTDRLTLTFGARYDHEELDQTIFDSTIVPAFPPTGNPLIDQVVTAATQQFSNTAEVTAQNTFSAFLPKGVVRYQWTDDFSTSVSIQRAYRAGGLSINLFRAALQPSEERDQNILESAGVVNRFDPEFTTNYELAMRSQWFDGRLTLNANLFYVSYDDQQVNIQLSSNPLDTITDNVGQSRMAGFEMEAFANPVEGLDLFANVGFTDTEFTEGADVIGGVDLTGLEFAFAPTWTAGGGARYTHESGLYGNARIRYTGNSFSVPDNDPTALNDSFTTVDLIFGYETDMFTAEVFATNILDDAFLTLNPANPTLGATAVAGDPRVIGIRLVAGF